MEYFGASTRFSDFRALRVRADALGRFYARPLLGESGSLSRRWTGGDQRIRWFQRMPRLAANWAMGFAAISVGLIFFYLSH
jgi:hypothetical protein